MSCSIAVVQLSAFTERLTCQLAGLTQVYSPIYKCRAVSSLAAALSLSKSQQSHEMDIAEILYPHWIGINASLSAEVTHPC